MKFRFLKTILMTDFISGFIMAIKELFKSKKTINYPFEKGKISLDIEVNMLCVDTLMVKKDV